MSLPDLMRSALSATLGWRWVVLVDYDGDRNIRRVKFRGGRPYASRLGFSIRDVWLLDNGKLDNGEWVEAWEPYDPGAEKLWPTYAR